MSLAKNIFQPSLLFYLSFWVKVCSFQHWLRVRFLLLFLCFVFVFKFVLSQGWGGGGLLKMFFPSILEFELGFKWKRNDHNPIASTDTKDIV